MIKSLRFVLLVSGIRLGFDSVVMIEISLAAADIVGFRGFKTVPAVMIVCGIGNVATTGQARKIARNTDNRIRLAIPFDKLEALEVPKE